jgi:hypothetical protein
MIIKMHDRDPDIGDLVIYDVDGDKNKKRRYGIVLDYHKESKSKKLRLLFNPPVYEVAVFYSSGDISVEEWYAGATRVLT